LVILRESLSDLAHPGAHDRIIGSIVVRSSPKNLNPNSALFEYVFVPLEAIFDNISKKGLALLAAVKRSAGQDLPQCFVDSRSLRILLFRSRAKRYL
jgi:hypothetical protein